MEKKATGWVPDYPDIKDYTLSSKAIRSVLNPVQGTQIAGSLESQKDNILRLLKLIATQAGKEDIKDIKDIQEQIDQAMSSEVNLVEVKPINPKDSPNEHNEKGECRVGIFDIERIPAQVFKVILEKLLPDLNIEATVQKSEKPVDKILPELIYPMVKTVAQIISPIAENSNIEKAVVEKGIKYFKTLICSDETENSKNYSISDYQTMLRWKADNEFFEYLACSAVLDVKLALENLIELDEKNQEIYNTINLKLQPYFDKALKCQPLPFKKVLEFDGKDDCLHVESFEWAGAEPVTVEFWAKVNKADVNNSYAFIIGKQTDSNYFGGVNLPWSNRLLYWEYGNHYATVDYGDYLNEWTHVALIFDEKNKEVPLRIYLNGEKVDGVEVIRRENSFSDPILKGLWLGTSDNQTFFKGKMAEFRIWKEACSLEQIRKNMGKQLIGSEYGLVCYWAFDKGEGNKVADKTKFNNSGILYGDPNPIDFDNRGKWLLRDNLKRHSVPKDIQKTILEMMDSSNNEKESIENEDEYRSEGQETQSLQFPILPKYLDKIKIEKSNITLPEFVDLSFWCSPIEAQGSLNSCTANAAVALMEYFQKKSFGKYIDGSRLFLYKATRNLMQIEGNVGTSIRSTMKAMALFGVPPEEYWPYQEDKVNDEPLPFCYAFAQNYQALKYFRLDAAGIQPDLLLAQIKAILVAGIPCVFGFTLYHSIYDDSNPRGHIPFPHQRDKAEGGHAVVAVGYDDYKQIKNADGDKSQGALLIRNCWGTKWGEGGYGWLPYGYVLKGLTADWWSLLSSEWFDTEQFGLGGKDWTDNVGAGGKGNAAGQ